MGCKRKKVIGLIAILPSNVPRVKSGSGQIHNVHMLITENQIKTAENID